MQKIVAKDIQKAHPLQKAYSTDLYYTKLANQLLNDFDRHNIDLGSQTNAIQRYTALMLACYMEDIVSDSGQWVTFSNLCQQMFGEPVPMYHLDHEEYYADEPNYMAIRYLIWNAANEMSDMWLSPDISELKEMAMIAYARLQLTFEELPINEELTDDISTFLNNASKDFNKLREMLTWLFCDNYLTRSYSAEQIIAKRKKEVENYGGFFSAPSAQLYYAITQSILTCKIGPFALLSQEYLAALMRNRSMNNEAKEIEAIEVRATHNYKYTIEADEQWLQLTDTKGREIRVRRDEFTLPDETLHEHDGCAGMFVKYLGEWHINGVIAPTKNVTDKWDEFVKSDPDYHTDGITDMTGEMMLENTGGKEIFYFADSDELKKFLADTIQFPDELLRNMNFPKEATQPLAFIDKNSKKYPLHFTFGFSSSIADPTNPFYNKKTAKEEAIKMFWYDDSVGTPTMLYLLEHGFIPDIYDDKLLCMESTMEQKRSDVQFLLRYMRKENY